MSDTDTSPASAAPARPAMSLRAQYIKDLSFENPRAPGSIFGLREAPNMEVSINLAAQRMEEGIFELAIQVSTRAVAEKTTIFLSDLVYAGILELRDMPAELVEQAIYVQGAQLLFPFARRVIADITRDGGFPPLQLDPVDFQAMYLEQRAKAQAAGNVA